MRVLLSTISSAAPQEDALEDVLTADMKARAGAMAATVRDDGAAVAARLLIALTGKGQLS